MAPECTESIKAAPKRQKGRQSPGIEKRLAMYAAAAAGATGALVLAAPAEAKVIYTPVHVVLTTVGHGSCSLGSCSYKVDLNHDGIDDFKLFAGNDFFQSGNRAFASCFPGTAASNMVWGSHSGSASALRQGVRIGLRGPFSRRIEFMGSVTYFTSARHAGFHGPWVNGGKGVTDRYLGLKFVINGKVHYGWARLNVKVRDKYIVSMTATLTGYAYETVPNRAIIAGKTKGVQVVAENATLGHLAMGASALTGWRGKTPAAAAH